MLNNETKPAMVDWRDIPVHEGDTIVFVQVLDGIDYVWRPYYESEVINYKGVLHMVVPGPDDVGDVLAPASLVSDLRDGTSAIFCIKGISDKEEDFYNEFYKPNMN